MITVGMNYNVIAGKEGWFEQAFDAVLQALQKDPQHTGTRLYREVHGAGSYLIVSEWSSREAFGQFVHSGPFAAVTGWGLEEILLGPPTHEIYERSTAARAPVAGRL